MPKGLSDGYAVLKGRVVDKRHGSKRNGHYQLHVVDEEYDHRIAVNVWSKLAPSEVLYIVEDEFYHPVTEELSALPLGLTRVQGRDHPLGLDFIRDNLFDRTEMRPLAYDIPGEDNDLNEKLDRVIDDALEDETALVYAFGEPWGPERKKDKIFGFAEGRGIHNIHMNQGNSGSFAAENGVHQDGALIVEFPTIKRWAAVFLAFQSQVWHTDDETGDPIDEAILRERSRVVGRETKRTPFGAVRVMAALVNPLGKDLGGEAVTLLNTSPIAVTLDGWALLDKGGHRQKLTGGVGPGETLRVALAKPMNLVNTGGTISLLDEKGLKVDGVSYTSRDVEAEGWTVVF